MSEQNSRREAVLADVIRLVTNVAAEWDFVGDIDEATRLFADVNWQSIDMVVLAHEIQDRYGRQFPFNDFFASLAQRDTPGVTIGELADFVSAQLAQPGTDAVR